MFTGIIEEVGRVVEIKMGAVSASIVIEAQKVLKDNAVGTDGVVGASIAVNGVCLTVTKIAGCTFWADVMPETLRQTNLGKLRSGSRVNLERAMLAGGRFGGHMVTGHIDGTGTISSKRSEGNAIWLAIDCDKSLTDGILLRGSIAIDGVSLTVANVTSSGFEVSLIPHTVGETVLLDGRTTDEVNLETDIIGKYVRRQLEGVNGDSKSKRSGLTMDFLVENGF